ncbi:MAG TPA: hypothetical protein VND93_22600 [Myxococcales bacterium]|nr:hypothetical protein [Myxococcales bacterium]
MSLLRHPLLLLLEAVVSAAVGGMLREGFLRAEARGKAPMEMTVSVLGETERLDGSWEGADLLARGDATAQRFQISVRVEQRARVSLDAVEGGDVSRLFPQEKREAILEPGRWYAIPGPRTFYELAGRAHLRLNVTPADRTGLAPEPADAVGPPSLVTFRLSDGSPYQLTRQSFVARGAARLQLELRAP